MTGQLAIAGVAYARANWGRWIVDCSSTACTSALAVEPGTREMRCWDCGWATDLILWPADTDSIETILAMRPDEKTRNWAGETLEDLLAENLAHGIIPAGIDMDGGDQVVMLTAGDRIVGGAMAAELDSYRRLQIGA